MSDDILDINKIVAAVLATIEDPKNLKEAADVAIDLAQTRTRLGKGVLKAEAKPTPLKKLTPRTVEIRKGLKKEGKLTGKGATPKRSGINRTGETLESMYAKSKRGEVEIQLDKRGTKVAAELEKISTNFIFMNLSKSEAKAMVAVLNEKVRKLGEKLK